MPGKEIENGSIVSEKKQSKKLEYLDRYQDLREALKCCSHNKICELAVCLTLVTEDENLFIIRMTDFKKYKVCNNYLTISCNTKRYHLTFYERLHL